LRVRGLGSGMQGLEIQGLGCRVWGFRVWGVGFGGLGFGVYDEARNLSNSMEDHFLLSIRRCCVK
jgi:hypothetical protein